MQFCKPNYNANRINIKQSIIQNIFLNFHMPFLVAVERKSSMIAGEGLFAKETIRKNEVIWEFVDQGRQYKSCPGYENVVNEFVSKQKLQAMDEGQQRHILYGGFYYPGLDGWVYLQEGSQFINHDDEANCLTIGHENENILEIKTIALRDIEIGQEITENYLTLQSSAPWAHELMCKVVPEQQTLDNEIISRLKQKDQSLKQQQ